MTEYINKIFIDTAPFIYLIENNKNYAHLTKELLKELCIENQFITSVVTYAEFCVKPKMINDTILIEYFKNLLSEIGCEMKTINLAIAETTANLRAKYLFLKTPDALQLGTAIYHNCAKFITNDKKLLKITELEIILISE